jgi:hypothetical protein
MKYDIAPLPPFNKHIIKGLNAAQSASLQRWALREKVPVQVEEEEEEMLDFEKFDERTKQAVRESIAAYRSGNMDYFKWQPEYEEIKQDLLALGIPIVCGEYRFASPG